MQKVNYDRFLDEKLSMLQSSGEKPSLLLHSCCAPCTSSALERLFDSFRITLYFCNPNIAPEEEYIYRLNELKRFVAEVGADADIVSENYDPAPFYELSAGLEDAPERGERCRRCIGYRLRRSAEKAKELGCQWFTTTLTTSPHKDSQFINQCGDSLAVEYGVPYLFSEFRKHDGYKRSIELSRKYQLYRQNYCGCVFSRRGQSAPAQCSAPAEV